MADTHRVILGGEQWLPFAESKLRALRLTGNPTAVYRATMPDGADVAVRIVGDQQFIRISGGSCTLRMDSGVVDVFNIAELNTATFEAGRMREPTAVAAYNDAFTKPDSTGERLLNPSSSSGQQISGTVVFGKSGNMKGSIPADRTAAASFTPKPILDTGTQPPRWIYDKRDESLWAKKIVGLVCPASVFTGRTRTWVQALYGRHLYGRGQDNEVKQDAVNIQVGIGSPPYIIVPSYKAGDDQADYPSVHVNSGTGVYLDPVTGKHWLQSMTAEGVVVHPLVGDQCAESLRKFLQVPPPEGLPSLNTEALEHLEAYILSRCLPDQKNKQLAACQLDMSFYSMGYSWHWNYSGTLADIVTNDQFQQFEDDDQFYAMKSSHYRVSTTKHENPDVDGKKVQPTWSASVQAFEKDVEWYINRTLWVIAEPDMANGVFLKTTPRRSQLFGSSGPFYAFYTGDVLNMCRVTFTVHAPQEPIHSESVDLYHSGIPGSLGDRAGYSRNTDYGSEYYTCAITCGPQGTGEMLWGHVISGANTEFSKKIVNPLVGPRWSNDDSYVTQSYEFGYPPYQVSPVIPSAIINTSYIAVGTHDIEVNTTRESWVSYATAIVPSGDAEAIYLQAIQEKTSTKTGTVSHYANGNFGAATEVNTFSYESGTWNPPLYFTRYGWAPFGIENGWSAGADTPINEVVVTTEFDVKKLICKAGSVSIAKFDGISELHEPEVEEAVAAFHVLAGASVRQPVVIADKADLIGISGILLAPVLVGWI